MNDEYLKAAEVGAKVRKSEAALAQWRYLGKGPKFIKLGRSVRYRASDVDAWLNQQTMQRTGEPGGAA
jgi:predicted DNA-binding transcriptional regulator AlpA